MSCCSIRDADTRVLFPTRVKLSKNPSDAGDSTAFRSRRYSHTYSLGASGESLTTYGKGCLKKKNELNNENHRN